MSITLSRDEVAELTRAQTRRRQIAFLLRNGIRHYVDGSGWPVVLRAAVEGSQATAQDALRWSPNKAA